MTLMSIDRHGINKSGKVLSLNVLLRKRRILLPERLYSVSLTELIQYHQILKFGQEVPIGIGSIDIMFDEEKYFENILSMPRKAAEEEAFIFERDQFTSVYCDNLF